MTPILAPQSDATAWCDDGGFVWGMELIQVPDVGDALSRSSRVDAWDRSWSNRTRTSRPRRRLRREFRTAACLCLGFAPIALAVGAWGLPPVRSAVASTVAVATNDADDADVEAVKIRLSVKPVEAEPEVPVILPGYVLPDEHRQEPAHEGS